MKESIKTFPTSRGEKFTSTRFNILCEESRFEDIVAEIDYITKNKTWEFVDRPAGVKHTGVCNTKMEACTTTHVPIQSSLARIKFKQMKSLFEVQEIDFSNLSWN